MTKKHLKILLICLVCLTLAFSVLYLSACKKNVTVSLSVADVYDSYSGERVTVKCSTSDGKYFFNGTDTQGGAWSVTYTDKKRQSGFGMRKCR